MRPAGKVQTSLFQLLADPLTLVIVAGSKLASGIAAADSASRGGACNLLVFPPWNFEDILGETLAAWEWLATHRRSWRPILLAQNERERALAAANGIETIIAHHNAFIDPRIHWPRSGTAKVFRAVHVANARSFKRHHLAQGLGDVALVTYLPDGPGEGLLDETIAGYRHLSFVNWTKDGGLRYLGARAVAEVIRQSRCGLVLSAREGSNFASAEYLMNGIPVVSTPSLGGREDFFDPRFVTICAPDAGEVSRAVEAWCAAPPDPLAVARACLKRGREDRLRLLGLLSDLSGQNLRRWTGREAWSPLFTNRLRKSVYVDAEALPALPALGAAAPKRVRRRKAAIPGPRRPWFAIPFRLSPADQDVELVCNATVRAAGPAFTPGHLSWHGGGVYDSRRRLHAALHRHRDADGGRLLGCWQRPGPTRDEALFGGVLQAHFGHFLCESIGRLWALERFGPEMPVVYVGHLADGAPSFPLMRAFFDLCGLPNPVLAVDHVADVRRLHLPKEKFFPMDGLTLQAELRAWFNRRVGARPSPAGPDLYISRSGLPGSRGHVLCETVIEQGMAEAGYAVLRPETLPLADQVAAYRAARRIVMSESSALHLLALAAGPDCRVAIIRRRPQGLIDLESSRRSLASGQGHFISAFRRVWSAGRGMPDHADVSAAEIDFPFLWMQLETLGFLPPGPHPAPTARELAGARARAADNRPNLSELEPGVNYTRDHSRRIALAASGVWR
jgi:hypothetical protein